MCSPCVDVKRKWLVVVELFLELTHQREKSHVVAFQASNLFIELPGFRLRSCH